MGTLGGLSSVSATSAGRKPCTGKGPAALPSCRTFHTRSAPRPRSRVSTRHETPRASRYSPRKKSSPRGTVWSWRRSSRSPGRGRGGRRCEQQPCRGLVIDAPCRVVAWSDERRSLRRLKEPRGGAFPNRHGPSPRRPREIRHQPFPGLGCCAPNGRAGDISPRDPRRSLANWPV